MEECSYKIVRKNRADIRFNIGSEGQMIITAPVEVSEAQIQHGSSKHGSLLVPPKKRKKKKIKR